MTDAEINIAIAEACGWSRIYLWQDYGSNYGRKELCGNHKLFGNDWRIPDYCHDLNAMHDAEKTLAHPEAFAARLGPIILRDGNVTNMDGSTAWHFAFAHATARQRAEAFVRMLGKYKENAGAAV